MTPTPCPSAPLTEDGFSAFDRAIAASTPTALFNGLAAGLIGEEVTLTTPYGQKPMVYADYTASGRALRQVENFVMEQVLPFYANSHTEASYCGGVMTRMRRDARERIARSMGAGDDHAVIFTGAGATAGINRVTALWQVGPDDLVILGPYEHHSNILPWRESGARLVTLPEGTDGGPCPVALARVLTEEAPTARQVICAFSAASNVTGDIADVAGLTRQAKAAGALILWDYAGGGPYLPMQVDHGAGAVIDAMVMSPHKCTGGPAATGLLVVRRASVRRATPVWSGGGTVRFVSPAGHDYAAGLEAREEAGTPDVIGDMRAALAITVKDAMLGSGMAARLNALVAQAERAWGDHPRIQLLGMRGRQRLPIFSFRIRDGQGGFVHQQLVTRMLSDMFGIQARGGCACAGPYVHQLLDIDPAQSDALRAAILSGDELRKPGFTRLNFSVLMTAEKVDHILHSLLTLADIAVDHVAAYEVDPARAIFRPRAA